MFLRLNSSDGIGGCCRTGVTGCGLFIACSFVMDQLAEEQEVDVAMAVSTVRKSRPQFIGTLVSVGCFVIFPTI